MNVVIYARYSSHNQTEQSIEGQLKECYNFTEKNDYNVVGEYVDRATTGTSDNREQFQQMIKDSEKKQFQGIIVYQLDRFSRSRYDSANYKHKLKQNGVRVFSAKENITEDASGILMESMLEGMAEYYSVELAQKVKRGMSLNADKCYYNGGSIPLGLKLVPVEEISGPNEKKIVKKKYAINEGIAPVVKKIFEMYLNDYTMADIIRYLNKQQIKTSSGNEFNKCSIRNILLNKKYIGIYSYGGTETKGAIPSVIEDNIFYQVQEKMLKNKQCPSRARAKTEYLLTTKLFCGNCKEMMIGVSGTSGTGKLHCYYGCKGTWKHKCSKKNVPKDYIEDLVVTAARNVLTDKNIETISNIVVKLAEKEKDKSNIKRLKKLLKQNEKEKENLFDSLKICDIDSIRKSIFEKMVKMDKQKIDIENQIRIEETNIVKITEKQVKYFLNQMRNEKMNDMKHRKILINSLINKVYLYDDNITIIFSTQNQHYETKIPTLSEMESSFMGKNAQPITNLFELQIQKSISKMVDFFVCEKIILKERMVSVMKIIKQEIQFEESLKQRLEFICEFSKVNPTFIKGSIRKIEKTNLSYIEPHKVIVKNITLLVFNYSNDVYISNLSKKIKLSELETYLKNI